MLLLELVVIDVFVQPIRSVAKANMLTFSLFAGLLKVVLHADREYNVWVLEVVGSRNLHSVALMFGVCYSVGLSIELSYHGLLLPCK